MRCAPLCSDAKNRLPAAFAIPNRNNMRTTSCCGLLLLLAACGTPPDRRVDPDVDDEMGALQSQDIRTIADKMARDLASTGILTSTANNQTVTFHITEMVNKSSDPIDHTIILRKLRTDLFKALGERVVVLDRSAEGLEAVKHEREAKRSGAVTSNEGKHGSVLGSDYVLKGVIEDRTLQQSSKKSHYYLVTMELTDLETGQLKWTGDYEAKFLSYQSITAR
jgi:PBP1b-binding outer membrane lipoprotein LpoB